MSAASKPSAAQSLSQVGGVELFCPKLTWQNLNWPVLAWMALMHVGAVAALFYTTWLAVGCALVLDWLTGSIGICFTYHRFLSHCGMKLHPIARFFGVLCGCLAVQGGPLDWAATHRLHHARSDQPGDPHSPRDGRWWSHMLWLFTTRSEEQRKVMFQKFVPDLLQDPIVMFFQRTFILWTVALGVGLYFLGGWPCVLWGICMRITLRYHGTWLVNSATHLWGYKTYDTRDDSRNLWWVAILAYGEGWHNNHHAFPRLARAGHRWWEVDVTFWAIRCCEFVGLATNVQDQLPSHADKRRLAEREGKRRQRETRQAQEQADLATGTATATLDDEAAVGTGESAGERV